MRKALVLFALLGATSIAAAQGPGEYYGEGVTPPDAAAHGEGGEGGHHGGELEHLQIHGIADLFVIPTDLPEEVRVEREHVRNQLLAAFVNFGLLITILVVKVMPSVRKGLVDRRNGIAKELDEAARLKTAAEAKHREYQSRLAQLDEELATIRADMKKAAETEGARIVDEAKAKAERARKETEFLIEQRMKSLRQELTREAAVRAVEAAEAILREKAGADDQQRLSKAYLASVAAAGKEGRA